MHSELGCACFEDSQSILELLTATYSEGPENQNPNQVLEFYEALAQHLNHKVICKDATQLVKRNTKSFEVGIITQLEAIGPVRPQVVYLQTFFMNCIRLQCLFDPFVMLWYMHDTLS